MPYYKEIPPKCPVPRCYRWDGLGCGRIGPPAPRLTPPRRGRSIAPRPVDSWSVSALCSCQIAPRRGGTRSSLSPGERAGVRAAFLPLKSAKNQMPCCGRNTFGNGTNAPGVVAEFRRRRERMGLNRIPDGEAGSAPGKSGGERAAVQTRARRAWTPGKCTRVWPAVSSAPLSTARKGWKRSCRNRVAVGNILRTMTQGSSCLATLGSGTESRWDSRMAWRGEIELRLCFTVLWA